MDIPVFELFEAIESHIVRSALPSNWYTVGAKTEGYYRIDDDHGIPVAVAIVKGGHVVMTEMATHGGELFKKMWNKKFPKYAVGEDEGPVVWAVLVREGGEWTFCGEHPFSTRDEALANVFIAGRNPGIGARLVSYHEHGWSLAKGLFALTSQFIVDQNTLAPDDGPRHFIIATPRPMIDYPERKWDFPAGHMNVE